MNLKFSYRDHRQFIFNKISKVAQFKSFKITAIFNHNNK